MIFILNSYHKKLGPLSFVYVRVKSPYRKILGPYARKCRIGFIFIFISYHKIRVPLSFVYDMVKSPYHKILVPMPAGVG